MTTERSEKQREASRVNGARGRGPTSREGKGRSRMNNLRHGLRSEQVVLPGESAEEFNAELKGWRGDWRPACHTAAVLVERAAAASWRLRRCVRAESDLVMEMAARAERRRGEAGAADDRIDVGLDVDDDPAPALAELRRSPEGVDRLIERWDDLRRPLRGGETALWGESEHAELMKLLGHPADADAAAAGPPAVDSARLAASNDSRYLADRLPGDEAEAIAARLLDGLALRRAELEALGRELAEAADDDGDDDEGDSALKFVGVTRRTMLLHRYEMSIERSMRGALRDLIALEKARPGSCSPPECLTEVFGNKEVKNTAHVPRPVPEASPAAAEPGPSPAPDEPEPWPVAGGSGGPSGGRGGRPRRRRRRARRRSAS